VQELHCSGIGSVGIVEVVNGHIVIAWVVGH
jgi:hypothetical protein